MSLIGKVFHRDGYRDVPSKDRFYKSTKASAPSFVVSSIPSSLQRC